MLAREIVTYLEMTEPAQLQPGRVPDFEIDIRRVEAPCPEINRFFYTAVGGDWYWVDRLGWTYADWQAFLTRPGHETWVAYYRGTPIGYFELEGPAGGDVEIASFGLLSDYVGQGLGGHLLTTAVRRAWDKPAGRVWLHTCSFDHPQALANYLARGFCVYKTEESLKELPDVTPGPWPGADARRRD